MTQKMTDPLAGWRCLYLPGFTGTSVDIEPLAEHAGGQWDTLVQPGHAGGAWPVPRDNLSSTNAIAGAVAAWLNSDTASTLLVGYSSGARPALAATLVHGCRPSAMLLVGATAGIEDTDDRAARALADHELAAHIERIGTTAFLDEWARHPMIVSQERVPEKLRTKRRAAALQHDARGLSANLRTMGQGASPSHWPRLHELQTPTLLLTGIDDSKYSDIAEQMAAESLMFARAKIPNAGHCAHVEEPYLTARALDAFLRASLT
jgi:2-succinyl-6-hydroxy-2,4-cyclohexadiene-1-carboxylate synthase